MSNVIRHRRRVHNCRIAVKGLVFEARGEDKMTELFGPVGMVCGLLLLALLGGLIVLSWPRRDETVERIDRLERAVYGDHYHADGSTDKHPRPKGKFAPQRWFTGNSASE